MDAPVRDGSQTEQGPSGPSVMTPNMLWFSGQNRGTQALCQSSIDEWPDNPDGGPKSPVWCTQSATIGCSALASQRMLRNHEPAPHRPAEGLLVAGLDVDPVRVVLPAGLAGRDRRDLYVAHPPAERPALSGHRQVVPRLRVDVGRRLLVGLRRLGDPPHERLPAPEERGFRHEA